MSKKKPCIVTITETRHKKQPFLVTIDKAGKAEPYQLKQRYSRKDAAVRGALRNLKAFQFYIIGRRLDEWIVPTENHAGILIQFVFNKK